MTLAHDPTFDRDLVHNEKLAAIGQLAHGIAHELNTPLGVIVSNLSVLEQYAQALTRVATAAQRELARVRDRDVTGPETELLEASLDEADLGFTLDDLPQLLADSTASADRMAAIIRSIATFARQDAEQPASVNVEEALETAVTLAWNELKHHATVERNLTQVPFILGHASELTQVFVHLLLNAAQALEDRPGTITIATACDGRMVTVTIADTGHGIAPEHLAHIFEPFFSTRSPGQGTGMGLAVCHGIITRHGGAMNVASTPGRGTKLTVRLPIPGGEAWTL